MLYDWLRPLLFRLDAETAHDLTLKTLRFVVRGPLSRVLATKAPVAPVTVMGIEFPNPVGLAAGLDKNADYIEVLEALGFGFIEVGTVTPRPQSGNPRPRLFRLPEAQALINRMGFNNKGVEHLIERVKCASFRGVLGINIGKNAATLLERAVDDYLYGLQSVYPYADYVAVNISSPNTPGLRDLQYGSAFDHLLASLKQVQTTLAATHGRYVPLAVKLAPDLADEDIPKVSEALLQHGIDAVIATNTTFSRHGVEGLAYAEETGGLSGAPLTARATAVVKQLHESLQGRLPIIAAGGIMSGADAQAKIAAGASLVQLYTGLIYRGPGLVHETLKALHEIDRKI